MRERAFQFVKHLAKTHPQGKWEQFIAADGAGLDWAKVIISGASHGATSAARFAVHQRVDRVVMLCGPRDQLETWQGFPSATPANRFFGFSHVLDTGWTGDHYCRSWQMLGLHAFGPITDVDATTAPFGNSRRLITKFDVKGDAKRAHSSVQPGTPPGRTRRANSSTKRCGNISSPIRSIARVRPRRLIRSAVRSCRNRRAGARRRAVTPRLGNLSTQLNR